MDGKIVIFAGAGASKAVSSSYPTTVEFFKNLPESIKEQKFFVAAEDYIKKQGHKGAVDIEMILWELQKLVRLGRAIEEPGFVQWMLSSQRLPKMLGRSTAISSSLDVLRESKNKVESLVSEINEYVYNFYADVPEVSSIESNWLSLFRSVGKTKSKIDIFTTNYDLVIESALNQESVAEVGWRDGVVRKLDASLWEDAAQRPEGVGLLTKLHGSINWSRDSRSPESIYIGGPDFKGNHGNHVIIYPGFKGRPSESLFQAFHAHLERAVSEAHAILFIGFAFRDEYINEIFERSIKDSCDVCSINPEDVSIPFETNRMKRIHAPFDEESSGLASDFLYEAIDFDVTELL